MIWESRILRMAEGDDTTAGAGYNLEEVLQAQGKLIEQRMQENKLAMQRKEILMEQVEVMKLQITMSEDTLLVVKSMDDIFFKCEIFVKRFDTSAIFWMSCKQIV